MKKYLLFLICALLLVVTGCGKKQLVCSRTGTVEGKTMSFDIVVDLDGNDKATNASLIIDYGDETLAQTMCESSKKTNGDVNIECSGTKVIMKNMDESADQAEDSDDMIGKTKEEIIKVAEEQGFTCK